MFYICNVLNSFRKKSCLKQKNHFLNIYLLYFIIERTLKYWVVRKVHADFEGKLKRRRFKFLISFKLNLNLLRHELSGQPNILKRF